MWSFGFGSQFGQHSSFGDRDFFSNFTSGRDTGSNSSPDLFDFSMKCRDREYARDNPLLSYMNNGSSFTHLKEINLPIFQEQRNNSTGSSHLSFFGLPTFNFFQNLPNGNKPKFNLQKPSGYNSLFSNGRIQLDMLRKVQNDKRCKEEYGHLKAYWPCGSSGVTLATGLDLSAQSTEQMKRYGVPSQLVNKLSKYIGSQIKGEKAKTFLANNPLEITVRQAEILNEFSVNKSSHRLAHVVNKYNQSNPSNKVFLENQPDYVVTTLFCYIYQRHYGNINQLLKVLSNGDIEKYCEAHKNIDNNERAPDHRRRAEEAQYCLDQHRKSQK